MLFDNKPPMVRKAMSLDEFSVSTSQSMGASFDQSWTETPINSIYRDQELIRANVGYGEVKYHPYSPETGYDIEYPPVGKKLDKEDAERQIKEAGVSLKVIDEGYTQKALDILIERKKEELSRASKMNAAKGFIPEVGKFSAAMAAQVLDPINVAASFIPVVAPSKYAAMLKASSGAAGRAAVRAGVGAAEGVVGAALVEPIIYMAKQREQADYTMADSLINVGLGAVMGAGLHAGAGAVGDAIRKGKPPVQVDMQGTTPERVSTATPETREAMLKTALAQEAEGVKTNVDAVASYDPNLSRVDSPIASEQAVKAKVATVEGEPGSFTVEANSAAIKAEVKESVATAIKIEQQKKVTNKDLLSGYERVAMEARSKGVSKVELKGDIPTKVIRELEGKGYKVDKPKSATVKGDEWKVAKDESISIDLSKPMDTPPPATASKSQSLEDTAGSTAKRGSDEEYSSMVDEQMKQPETSVDDELAYYSESSKAIDDALGIKVENAVELDDAIKKAESDAKALEAAVTCRITK